MRSLSRPSWASSASRRAQYACRSVRLAGGAAAGGAAAAGAGAAAAAGATSRATTTR